MARALKQAGSTPKEGGQYVNVLFCFVFVLQVMMRIRVGDSVRIDEERMFSAGGRDSR